MWLTDGLLVIIAVFIPPLAVLLKRGCGAHLLLSIVLTSLYWIPGVLHAWLVIVTTKRRPRLYRTLEPAAAVVYRMGSPMGPVVYRTPEMTERV